MTTREFVNTVAPICLILCMAGFLASVLSYRCGYDTGADEVCDAECDIYGNEYGWHDYPKSPGCICANEQSPKMNDEE